MAPQQFKNFIAGDWVVPAAGEYFENRNPADWNDVIGLFPRSGADDLKRAIASAKRGFAQWSKTPAPIRGQVLQRVAPHCGLCARAAFCLGYCRLPILHSFAIPFQSGATCQLCPVQ